MTAASAPLSYSVGSDEKVAQVMAYTPTALIWGEVVVKEMIRVSTWLRTNAAPDRVTLYNAKSLVTTSANTSRPTSYPEVNIPVPQILAWHLAPPAKDPIDYDPTEPNRHMEPVNALLSTFQVKGSLRLSSNSNLKKYLEVTREAYTGLYDAEITNLLISNIGPIMVPYILIRQTLPSSRIADHNHFQLTFEPEGTGFISVAWVRFIPSNSIGPFINF